LHGPDVGKAAETQLTLNFTAPVIIGDAITAEADVIEKIDEKRIVRLRTVCRNQDGKIVIDDEVKLLKEMMLTEE
jgi:3-hydroxybutyryl-CoA dehydratase